MNRIALVAALIAGAAGIFLMQTHKARFEQEVSGGAPVPVLMVTKDVTVGTAITDDMLGIRDLPEAYVEERHVRAADAHKLIGVRLGTTVQANESLLWTDLATATGSRRQLSALVQNGKRAVSLRAEAGRVSGMVRAGDRVDLLWTTTRESGRATVPLLQNLLVLAVAGDTGDGRGDKGTTRDITARDVMTLSVTPAEAQIITLAREDGELSPILRNPDDILVIDGLPDTTEQDLQIAELRVELQRKRQRSLTPPATGTDGEEQSNGQPIEKLR